MVIPAGKKVKIRENGQDIFEKAGLTGIEMVLDAEITMSLSSTFDELLNFNTNKMLVAGTSLFQAITGKVLSTQFKEMGYRMWTKTDPIKFSVTSTFNMTYSGEEEVLKPYLYKNGKRIAYITGTSLYNRLGLTTQIPTIIKIASRDKRITVSNGTVKASSVKSYVSVTDSNFHLLELLEEQKELLNILMKLALLFGSRLLV